MVFFTSAILFALFAGAFDGKKRRKRKSAAKKSGEPQAKRLKRSAEESSSSSSSEDDDDSMDSDSSFDIFSSESETESDASTYEDYESDHSQSQNDISIKEEPFWDSETELRLNGDANPEERSQQKGRNSRRTRKQRISNDSLPVTEIKTEVLDSIVEAVEVDRNSLLNSSSAVQIKEEPADEIESTEAPVEIKQEVDTNDVTSSSQQDVAQN